VIRGGRNPGCRAAPRGDEAIHPGSRRAASRPGHLALGPAARRRRTRDLRGDEPLVHGHVERDAPVRRAVDGGRRGACGILRGPGRAGSRRLPGLPRLRPEGPVRPPAARARAQPRPRPPRSLARAGSPSPRRIVLRHGAGGGEGPARCDALHVRQLALRGRAPRATPPPGRERRRAGRAPLHRRLLARPGLPRLRPAGRHAAAPPLREPTPLLRLDARRSPSSAAGAGLRVARVALAHGRGRDGRLLGRLAHRQHPLRRIRARRGPRLGDGAPSRIARSRVTGLATSSSTRSTPRFGTAS
jgi:hypothetical protein